MSYFLIKIGKVMNDLTLKALSMQKSEKIELTNYALNTYK